MKIESRTAVFLNPYEFSKDCIRKGIKRTVLSFSGGKDCIAAWCCMQDAGMEVIPLHFQNYAGKIPCIENTLAFYEKFFGRKIHRTYHASVYNACQQMLYKDPQAFRAAWEAGCLSMPKAAADLDRITEEWQAENGEASTLVTVGIKRVDSPNRAKLLMKRGQLQLEKNGYRRGFPMAGMLNRHVVDILNKYKCPLPSYYKETGESIDVLSPKSLAWMKKHDLPSYYAVLQELPLAELLNFRMTLQA